MTSCYLTIDDSPSIHTDGMIDFLCKHNVPAILFCRGDLLEQQNESIIRAIKKGFIIANHSYAHKPYGTLTYEECIADIKKCESLIENTYATAGIQRPAKYFRFPYLDRGNGDRIERHFETVSDIDINSDSKVQTIQTYLKSQGFTQPFFKTNHPIYNNASIRDAADCLMTFTSFDWMLTERHIGKWDFKTIDDLKNRIDRDIHLQNCDGNILIFHDQIDTLDTFKSLIDHMLNKGYEFLSY